METSHRYLNKLYAWVILDNHVHLLIKTSIGRELYKFINAFEGKTAKEVNKLDNRIGRKVWYQYWDRCVRSEKDFYTKLNYIHHNPLKHKSAKRMEDYEFSSYCNYLKKFSKK